MKAEELRIGNILQYNGAYKMVRCVDLDRVHCRDSNDPCSDLVSYAYLDLQPVPLTPEVLDKIEEFENLTLDAECYYGDKKHLFILHDSGYGYWNAEYDGKMLGILIRGLHELQNLYSTLTGKELTIKM